LKPVATLTKTTVGLASGSGATTTKASDKNDKKKIN